MFSIGAYSIKAARAASFHHAPFSSLSRSSFQLSSKTVNTSAILFRGINERGLSSTNKLWSYSTPNGKVLKALVESVQRSHPFVSSIGNNPLVEMLKCGYSVHIENEEKLIKETVASLDQERIIDLIKMYQDERVSRVYYMEGYKAYGAPHSSEWREILLYALIGTYDAKLLQGVIDKLDLKTSDYIFLEELMKRDSKTLDFFITSGLYNYITPEEW